MSLPKTNLLTFFTSTVASDTTPDYYVYTDGSCSNNGKIDAKAGMGVYFGKDDPRNVSRRVEGKQTNNTAELGAIRHAYDIIKADVLSGKRVTIVSDSLYAIGAATTYGDKCVANGWTKEIPNKELVKETYELYKPLKNVKFLHVLGHTEKNDPHSLGNAGADALANQAIGLESCPYSSAATKIYLTVPYAKKDEAKVMGAMWDATAKRWYTLESCVRKDELAARFG